MSNGEVEPLALPYTKVNFVDGTTPLNNVNLDKLDQGIKDLSDLVSSGGRLAAVGVLITDWNAATQNGWYRAAGSALNSPGPGVAAVGMVLADSPNYLLQIAHAHNDVTPPVPRIWYRTRIGGTWGSWALLSAGGGGGGGLDWEGEYAAATPYVKGDVVTYQGVTYGAVNDSTGQTPPVAQAAPGALPVIPLVTSLPATPFDGQEIILVDVIGAATFAWRLRYVAARAANKWIFVGGSPLFNEVAPGTESTTQTAYVNLATIGPSITLPLAGDYIVEQGACSYNSGGYACYMSYDIGATPANDVDAMLISSTNASSASMRSRKKLALPAVALVSKYRVSGTTGNWHSRWMRVTPIAVGG